MKCKYCGNSNTIMITEGYVKYIICNKCKNVLKKITSVIKNSANKFILM